MRVPKVSLYEGPSGYRVRFTWRGKKPYRSLGTKKRQQAEQLRDGIQATLADVVHGRLTIPSGVGDVDFIVSGGTARPPSENPTLQQAVDDYQEFKSDLDFAEVTRCNTLVRLIGANARIRDIRLRELRSFVSKRSKEKHRDKRISGTTIGRELATFWRVRESAKTFGGWIDDPLDVKATKTQLAGMLPKREEKRPFQTYDELQSQEDDLTDEERKDLWECLFLQPEELMEVLTVLEGFRRPFVRPMVAAAIYTGARRSELCRSLVVDWDFSRGLLQVRERKRKRNVASSFRSVDLSTLLSDIMQEWFACKPASRYAFCDESGGEISASVATQQLDKALKGSKWEVIKGWHTFRHTFASICAMRGVADAVIDGWMGHTTAEMRSRYRHLYPQQRRSEMDRVFA